MDKDKAKDAVGSSDKATIDKLQDEIVDEFLSIEDPLSQYEYLIEYAASLPRLDAALKHDGNLVKGCQSRAWLVMKEKDGKLSLRADSDTLIVRGILRLLIDVFDGQPLDDVANADVFFLEKADLMATFNSSRRQGVGSIISTIKQFAKAVDLTR